MEENISSQPKFHKYVKLFLLVPFLIIFALSLFLILDKTGQPENVQVTNITSNSATISWTTTKETGGKVMISEEDSFPIYKFVLNDKNKTFYDDRFTETINDNGEITIEYNKEIAKNTITHHVTLQNLNPDSTYYFRIVGKYKIFNAEVSSFKTLTLSNSINSPDPIYGSVYNILDKNAQPTDGIIYFKLKSKTEETKVSNLYSAVLDSDSGWSSDLSNIRDEKGDLVIWNPENYVLEAQVFTEDGNSSLLEYSLEEYKPLKTIVINSSYSIQQ